MAHTKSDADERHEELIRECFERWLEHEAMWSELVALINARSPQQVAKMEKEMHLT